MRGARRGRIGLGVELDDDGHQQRQHEQRDQRDDHQEPVVEPVDVIHHRRDRALKAELPGRRLPRSGPRHIADRKSGHHRSRQCGQPLKHQHRRHCSFDEYRRDASLPHRGRLCRSRPAPDKAPRWGPRSSAGGAARGDFPGFSNHNSGAVAMCLNGCPMRQSGYFAYVAIRGRNRWQASTMQAKIGARRTPPPLFTSAPCPGRRPVAETRDAMVSKAPAIRMRALSRLQPAGTERWVKAAKN